MRRPLPLKKSLLALAVGVSLAPGAQALSWAMEGGSLSLDSTVTLGTGFRLKAPACDLLTQGASGNNAPTGCLAPTAALGDQGNLNYAKGDRFTTYLKGSHEMVLKLPEQVTVLGRVNWLKDFSAAQATGLTSATTPPTVQGGLAEDARSDLKFKARLLDLWVSKTFDVGGQQARLRVGNQVVSWGESLFLPGGINSTNAMDVMRLSQPGTQLKEAVLPAPMVSVASSLGGGFNAEAYVQTKWNSNYMPPTGSFWSVSNGLGKGHDTYGLLETKARDGGQWGATLRYQPEGTALNLGLYAMNYHDKGPQFSLNVDGKGGMGFAYPEDRKLFGISANFPVGDWAIGGELSYRPKDAVAINPAASGCGSQMGNCWVDEKRYQGHVTALLSLTPSVGGGFLNLLGAQTATLLAEAAFIRYPNLQRSYGGDPIAAGAWGWGQEFDPTAAPQAVGTKTSWGYNFDFSWVYDGTVIPGWQVVPEVFFFHAVKGRMPNGQGLFMEGAKSLNFIVSLIQNPATWQVSANIATFWGGARIFDQPYRDRTFVGLTLARNF